MMNNEAFANLNFGTIPTTVKLDEVSINLDSSIILKQFAVAYAKDLARRQPVRAKEVNLTAEELYEYFQGLLKIRVDSIHGTCSVWRQAKALYMPCWIEFVLTQIGIVVDRERGLKLDPKFEFTLDMEKMKETSERLSSFMTGEGAVVLVKDAFPRKEEGDMETMSMAIIGDYVCSMAKTSHPIASYVAGFLGFTLEKETAFKMLYRVRYDDIEMLRELLIAEHSIR